MKPSKEQNRILAEWLGERLDPFLAQADKVAALLEGTGQKASPQVTQKILEAAAELVEQEQVTPSSLLPEKVEQWKKLLAVVTEHAGLMVQASPPAEADRSLNKEEAADFLKISVRKLEKHMQKRDIVYEKLGAGKSARVMFNQSDLIAFKAKHTVAARRSC